jgi:hypothetical protein
MWTDRFCPKCGLKLAEVRAADGDIEPGHIACRNMHSWRWTVVDEGNETLQALDKTDEK